jgi:hypothetical protein
LFVCPSTHSFTSGPQYSYDAEPFSRCFSVGQQCDAGAHASSYVKAFHQRIACGEREPANNPRQFMVGHLQIDNHIFSSCLKHKLLTALGLTSGKELITVPLKAARYHSYVQP